MKRILVVEDEDNMRQMILDILLQHGYCAFAANDGQSGISMALKEHPDLIICDVKMPVADGFEVLKNLQKNKMTASLPFIFLTGLAERSQVRRGMESGADDYITKPFTDEELVNAVRIQFRKIALKYSAENSSKKNTRTVKEFEATDHIFVEVNKAPTIMKLSSIKQIISMGDYSQITTDGNKKIVVRKTMKQWEEILPENTFLRIHRKTIINMGHMDKIEKWFNNTVKVYMKDSRDPLIISRRYFTKIKHSF